MQFNNNLTPIDGGAAKKIDETKDSTEFGGGGGGPGANLVSIGIVSVSNGWIITGFYDDGSEHTEVFDTESKKDHKKVIKSIVEFMGLQDSIELS